MKQISVGVVAKYLHDPNERTNFVEIDWLFLILSYLEDNLFAIA